MWPSSGKLARFHLGGPRFPLIPNLFIDCVVFCLLSLFLSFVACDCTQLQSCLTVIVCSVRVRHTKKHVTSNQNSSVSLNCEVKRETATTVEYSMRFGNVRSFWGAPICKHSQRECVCNVHAQACVCVCACVCKSLYKRVRVSFMIFRWYDVACVDACMCTYECAANICACVHVHVHVPIELWIFHLQCTLPHCVYADTPAHTSASTSVHNYTRTHIHIDIHKYARTNVNR
jgi:hypothetical protein